MASGLFVKQTHLAKLAGGGRASAVLMMSLEVVVAAPGAGWIFRCQDDDELPGTDRDGHGRPDSPPPSHVHRRVVGQCLVVVVVTILISDRVTLSDGPPPLQRLTYYSSSIVRYCGDSLLFTQHESQNPHLQFGPTRCPLAS